MKTVSSKTPPPALPQTNQNSHLHTQVFYDGTCHVCFREISHYQKLAKKLAPPNHPSDTMEWIDIAHPDFDATFYDLNPKRVTEVMHVRVLDKEGVLIRVATAVDAFVEIWRALPQAGVLFRVLSVLVQNPLLKPLVRLGYYAFAKVRLKLPKRKNEYICRDGVCRPGFLYGQTQGDSETRN